MFNYGIESLLYSTTEIKIVLSSQCTIGAPVWSSKDSIYLNIALFFLEDLYMHLISPPEDSESITG